MGDIAEYLTEQETINLINHHEGNCPDPCQYCEEEERMKKKSKWQDIPSKKKPKGPSKLPYRGWRLEHGISQSLFQKFVNCKDRAHKHAIQGLRTVDRKEAMEYGTIFHRLIEEGAKLGNRYTRAKITNILQKYISNRYGPTDDKAILLARIAIVQYDMYRKWELDKPKYKYVDQEVVFAEQFPLPATRWNPCPEISINIPRTNVLLRGRIDELIDLQGHLWLQENKTKSRIDISTIKDTVASNIQVMFYAVAAELKYGRPIKGIIYNVIRKPGQRQRQNESDEVFLARIEEDIEKDLSYYFYRITYSFPPGAVAKWKREELIPGLYDIYIWWKSIEKNPTQPWEDEEGNINPFHGRKSFGIYDPMSNGKGEFYDLIVNGITRGLKVDYEMFPELKDEE